MQVITAPHETDAKPKSLSEKDVDLITKKGIMQTVTVKITSIDEANRTFTSVASDETVDRHGENILLSAWRLDNYIKNPVGLWSHDYWQPACFTTTEIGYSDGELIFTSKWPSIEELSSNPDTPSDWALFVDSLYNSYKGGYLRAFSVGLIPKKWSEDWQTIIEAELLEISAVTVPANPNALALAVKEGLISRKQAKIFIKSFEAQIKSLTSVSETSDNDGMSSELTEAIKANNEKLDKLIGVLSKDSGDDTPPADPPADDNPPADPPADDDATPSDDPKPGTNPDDKDEPADKPAGDDPASGADDDDPEIDPDNVTEEQAKQIAAGAKASLEKDLGRVN